MKYVYILQSIPNPDEYYVGITDNFNERMANHNCGGSKHTAKFRPWKALVVLRFSDDQKAQEFERYLKSGSGRAFAARHFR
ncbi:MAG: GIY-YIG nuclease family protein [Planctomycetes bacterium]|nr:GIY-YIG nuclease family protein [Planctomycetota bacterium]